MCSSIVSLLEVMQSDCAFICRSAVGVSLYKKMCISIVTSHKDVLSDCFLLEDVHRDCDLLGVLRVQHG